MPQPSQADLPFLTIREASELIRTRRLSPVELVTAALDRIDALNPRLNAYITVTRAWALDAARSAEAEIMRGGYKGPLHGIPFGLKDLIETAGVPTTAASKVLADNVPTEHAPVVTRLLAAGAVIAGKQNLHEFAYGFTNVNSHFGIVPNPYKPDHIAGGSSGGTAAAVAAGLCTAGIGSDTGGSIRVPAAYCNLSGLKPTHGRVSLKGVMLISWTQDHLGPLARSAEDAAIILNAIAGYEPSDPHSANVPVGDFTTGLADGVRGMRLGVVRPFLAHPALVDEVRQAFAGAVASLRTAGADVVEVDPPMLAELGAAGPLVTAESALIHEQWIADRASDYIPVTLAIIRSGFEVPVTTQVNRYLLRLRAIRAYDLFMEQYDALLCPTSPILAPMIDPDMAPFGMPYGAFTGIWSQLAVPALSVPCGAGEDGRPIGLQIVGRRWSESTVLRVGHAYQQLTSWHTRRPQL